MEAPRPAGRVLEARCSPRFFLHYGPNPSEAARIETEMQKMKIIRS